MRKRFEESYKRLGRRRERRTSGNLECDVTDSSCEVDNERRKDY